MASRDGLPCPASHPTRLRQDTPILYLLQMADHVDTQTRSKIMASVRSKDTKPELVVRRFLHRQGYRYRLHRKDLPGSPDIVFPSRRKVLFVHGCYWHGHRCRWGNLPKSNATYWHDKIRANRERDARNVSDLRLLGWDVHTVWQCELRDKPSAFERIVEYLRPG